MHGIADLRVVVRFCEHFVGRREAVWICTHLCGWRAAVRI
jgi:hypothetical protein